MEKFHWLLMRDPGRHNGADFGVTGTDSQLLQHPVLPAISLFRLVAGQPGMRGGAPTATRSMQSAAGQRNTHRQLGEDDRAGHSLACDQLIEAPPSAVGPPDARFPRLPSRRAFRPPRLFGGVWQELGSILGKDRACTQQRHADRCCPSFANSGSRDQLRDIVKYRSWPVVPMARSSVPTATMPQAAQAGRKWYYACALPAAPGDGGRTASGSHRNGFFSQCKYSPCATPLADLHKRLRGAPWRSTEDVGTSIDRARPGAYSHDAIQPLVVVAIPQPSRAAGSGSSARYLAGARAW